MNVWGLIKLVKPKHVWSLSKLCVTHPLFVIPTIIATRKCVKLSNEHYGKLHHTNGPANGFRHAVWNYLIARRCARWTKKDEKAVRWAKKVTDWHEDFSPNSELAQMMDVHNNEIGRIIFLQHKDKGIDDVILILKKMTKDSTKVDTVDNIANYKNQMVHIV
ncbi:DUF6973 domain-containing protein [Sungkyunkwania multivorans]|uniref:DUF6973 domain-containing protein n=1 Tax=Sungkyunkwania multivorans TaxID=1173618 RepID=A0ABW3CZS0_9FLAO